MGRRRRLSEAVVGCQIADHDRGVGADAGLCAAPPPAVGQERVATTVVYCEANFGAIDGKTANRGLGPRPLISPPRPVRATLRRCRVSHQRLLATTNGVPSRFLSPNQRHLVQERQISSLYFHGIA